MSPFELAERHARQWGLGEGKRFGNFVGGARQAPCSGHWIPVVDPATDRVIAEAPDSGIDDVDAAVTNAHHALRSSGWALMSPSARERVLLGLADLIEQHADELSALETLQSGKLQSVARMVDVQGGANFLRYMAGWATKLSGETLSNSLPSSPGSGHFSYTVREPIGVVGAIVPWNFPLAIALWKLAPALAAGCTVVLKPSEETPLTALRLAELAVEAGLPAGALNVVCGKGDVAGAALCAHPLVAKISFTGSTAVGKLVGEAAVQRMARLTLELGGKSPMLALADADVDEVAKGAANSVFFHQGQVYAAATRLYVPRSRLNETAEKVARIAGSLAIGSGFDPGSQIGPLVSKRQHVSVLGHIRKAKADGAVALAGGDRALEHGCFVQPTVFVDVRPDMDIVRNEVFGPVLVVLPYDDVEEAVAQANASPYGLTASIWSRNLSQIHSLVPRLQAGTIWINTHSMLDPNVPFGGVKLSGVGRDFGKVAVEACTELKTVCMAY